MPSGLGGRAPFSNVRGIRGSGGGDVTIERRWRDAEAVRDLSHTDVGIGQQRLGGLNVCEIASNCDPSQGRSISLITRVNPFPGWGHAWTRKMTPSIPIFRNEINALGNFREGVNIASEFTARPAGQRRGAYAGRIGKTVARLQTRYPDLAEKFLEDVVRKSWIADISDSQFLAESAYHVDWILAGSIPRDGYIPPKVSHIV